MICDVHSGTELLVSLRLRGYYSWASDRESLRSNVLCVKCVVIVDWTSDCGVMLCKRFVMCKLCMILGLLCMMCKLSV